MAITIKPARPLSDAELLALSHENPGYQLERDRAGRLVVTPTGGQTGRRSVEVASQLRNWTHERGSGPVFDSSTGFGLPDGSLLSPDAAWICKERWDALTDDERDGFPPLAPDAVFEVRSRSNTAGELRAKLKAYVENGVRVAVMVDPYDRAVEIWGRHGNRRAPYELVDLNEELPGFTLDLRAVD